MEEKTEELRELFLDVTDEETLTESQEEGRGSLAGKSGPVDERIEAVMTQLDERFGVETPLSTETECRLVKLFYAGESDAEIASALEVTEKEVFNARMELLLVRDSDIPEPELGREQQRQLLDDTVDGDAVGAVAAETGVDRAVVERARAALTANERSNRVSNRFRLEFEELLTDADLTVQFTVGAHEDGLEDATDGAEVDVEF